MTYFASRAALDDASWAAYRSRIAHRQLLRKELTPLSNFIPLFIRDWLVPHGQKTDVSNDSEFKRHSLDEDLARSWRVFGVLENSGRLILRGYMRAISKLFELGVSYISCYAFGYGEKPFRVASLSAFIIIAYAVLFSWFRVLPEEGFATALYFSIVTFTTLGYGDLVAKAEFRLLAASEALLGIVLVGLFLFALSRRAVGRG